MGITIRAKNSSVDFYLSYTAFFRLRTMIARNYNYAFGELYSKMHELDTFDQDMNDLLSDDKSFPEKDYPLLDFFFASDCEGKCNYKVCKRIYDLIKDEDDYNFQYAGFKRSESDVVSFKKFLLECYRYHRNMVWS